MSNSLQPMDCSPPGSSVHGILQARILEWVVEGCPPPGDLPKPRDRTHMSSMSCIADRIFTHLATREAQSYHMTLQSHSRAHIQKKTWSGKIPAPQMFVAALFYISQDMEAVEMSINRGMHKENVVHIHNGILRSHEKE